MKPTVSVVVASVGGSGALGECLAALTSGERPPAEILVVERCGGALRSELARRFPDVRVIPVEPKTSLPQMWARGLAAASSDTVAVLGEHLRPAPGWLAAVAAAGASGRAVVGGPVEIGEQTRSAEWAFFFLEYARFMLPLPAGPAPAVAGTNCVYARRLLDRMGAGHAPERVLDAALQDGLRVLGASFHSEPALVARCEKRLGVRGLLAQRYHCSRLSAAQRAREWPLWKRCAFAAATPLLPALLLVRLLHTLLAKRRHGRELLGAFPALLAGIVSGAWGEAVGVLAGAGDSGERAE